MLCSMSLLLLLAKSISGSVLVTSENCSTSGSGSSSKWAVNTQISMKHSFVPPRGPPVIVLYELDSVTMCEFTYSSSGSCSGRAGSKCGSCLNNYTSAQTFEGSLKGLNLTEARNGSLITYDVALAGVFDMSLHRFTLEVCPQFVGNASAEKYIIPCGYGCTSKFVCRSGFVHDPMSGISPETIYRCSCAAEWTPNVPMNLCKSKEESTTTETATTPTSPTTSNGSTQGDGVFFLNSGPSFAAIGGVLAAICIGVFVYMACTEIPNNVVLYAMFAICICVWAVALGLCFGLSTNKSAVIAGIVLGSLALAGMVVVIVFQFLHKKSHERKGIPGKPEKPEDPSL